MLPLPILEKVVLWTDKEGALFEETRSYDGSLRALLGLIRFLDPDPELLRVHLELLIVVTGIKTVDYERTFASQLEARTRLSELFEKAQTLRPAVVALTIGTGTKEVRIVVNAASEKAVRAAAEMIMNCASEIGLAHQETMSAVSLTAITLRHGADSYRRALTQLGQVQGQHGLPTRIPGPEPLAVVPELPLKYGKGG